MDLQIFLCVFTVVLYVGGSFDNINTYNNVFFFQMFPSERLKCVFELVVVLCLFCICIIFHMVLGTKAR